MDTHTAPQNSNPPPLPPPVDLYSHLPPHLYPAPNYSSHYYPPHQHSQNPNPNPNPNVPVDPLIKTHDPNSGLDQGGSSLAPPTHGAVHEPYDPAVAYAQAGYYQDPNFVNSLQNWAQKVIQYYGSAPHTTGVTVPPNGTNATVRPHGNGKWKKGPKKTKVIQSVWCEVCRVECNTKDVLDQHKMGKQHKKKVEQLTKAIAPPPPSVVNPVIGPRENPDKGKAAVGKTRKKAAETVEDLETKKRKIMEGGAAADNVRMCTICNVVCNSDLVFAFHMAGKKHAAMMAKKRVGGASLAIST